MALTKNKSENDRCDAANVHSNDAYVLTPAMQQYFEQRSAHPDCLLFYRMGDFYELFFEDANIASSILDIALTKRGKHRGEDIAMCGVPAHAADGYLHKLIASGHKVAICEQMETPEEAKKRGYKSVVRREVVRIVTAGTITEEGLLTPALPQYLAALHITAHEAGIGWLDITTGAFHVITCHTDLIAGILARIAPREILVSDKLESSYASFPWYQEYTPFFTRKPHSMFDTRSGNEALKSLYSVQSHAAFGAFSSSDIAVCGALIHYVRLTQIEATLRLDPPQKELIESRVYIDAATRRSLELTHTLSGDRKGSLLWAIDKTATASGSRGLNQLIHAPFTSLETIIERQDAVAYMLNHTALHADIHALLRQSSDIERAVGRVIMRRASARDLLSIRQTLDVFAKISLCFAQQSTASQLCQFLRIQSTALQGFDGLHAELCRALKDDVPLLVRDGGFVADGYRADLDEWRTLSRESKRIIAVMEIRLRNETDINSLKIKFNNILGYFIEITSSHEKKVPMEFVHRQTMAGALRYTTTELAALAQKMEQAETRALQCEMEVFESLSEHIIAQAEALIAAARAIAQLDIITAFATLAQAYDYVRPTLSNTRDLAIKNGRHPVIESIMQQSGNRFMANDCLMRDTEDVWLITGPNMAGKSTFLRQNALIILLAHMGCYVPAESAHIGRVDAVYSRVGAADDLTRGQSTFMVEMLETAAILHQATERSFVILDEIGRGTSTYDGLSIAWAVVEHLHDVVKCRTLFATHYHEMTVLESMLERVVCYHSRVREHQDTIVFLHQIEKGSANRSYGVQVAKLAGLPKSVITRAHALLHQLETEKASIESTASQQVLALEPAAVKSENTPFYKAVSELDPDSLSPKEALEFLYQLKKML